ncbi:MAG: sulfotransferase [Bacteroidales bacterium]|nr:sulfotransferase [Bacteroidales bacterium]
MSTKESPLITFTKKLREHRAFQNNKNKKVIYLIYLKLFLSEPFRLIEKKKYNKPIEKVKPEKEPVFIIGHWRSGTTYTHDLLSQDPHFIYQNRYQNFFSDNFLTTEKFFKPVLSEFIDLISPLKQWESGFSKSMELDFPSESDTALIAEISEFTYHWAHLFPKSYEKYFSKYLFLEDITDKELEEWKYAMRTMLNKVYLKHKKGRLLIKNPGDTARIKYLLDIYPSAKFIFIHRNPYDVFYSNLKLWSYVVQTVSLQQISEKEKKDIVLNVYKKLHLKYLEQKSLLNDDQLVEISYNSIVDYPLETLENIYTKLNLENRFDDAVPFFKSFAEKNASGSKRNYNYKENDIQEINSYWDFAFNRWDYPKINKKSGLTEKSEFTKKSAK